MLEWIYRGLSRGGSPLATRARRSPRRPGFTAASRCAPEGGGRRLAALCPTGAIAVTATDT